LFIHPPYFRFHEQDVTLGIPYGLLSVATILKRNGFNVAVYDADFDAERAAGGRYSEVKAYDNETFRHNIADEKHKAWKEIESIIKLTGPKMVGIGMMTSQYDISKKIAGIVKSLDKRMTVIVGGPHPTIMPEETASEDVFDFVVRGEGEITVLELVKEIFGKRRFDRVSGISYRSGGRVISTPERKLVKDIDSLPMVDRSLLIGYEKYPKWVLGIISASRGCPFRCTFCNSKSIWGTGARFRSEESVVDELENVYTQYGTREFNFLDDTFNTSEERVSRICDAIRKRRLDVEWSCQMRLDMVTRSIVKKVKSAGCYSVRVGVESGNQGILDNVNKGLTVARAKESCRTIKDGGLELLAWFIVGDLKETRSTIADTERLADEIRADIVRFTMMIPYPKTAIGDAAEREGRILSRDWSEYTGVVPLIRIEGMNTEELSKKFKELCDKYTSLDDAWLKRRLRNPRYVLRSIRENVNSPRTLLKLAKSAIGTVLG